MEQIASMPSTSYVITKFDRLNVIVEECPRAGELLAEYGLHCVNCFANEYDTIEMGAQVHGMSEEEVDEMVEEINAELEKEFRRSKIQITNFK